MFFSHRQYLVLFLVTTGMFFLEQRAMWGVFSNGVIFIWIFEWKFEAMRK